MIAEFFAGLVVAACAAKQVGEVVEGVAFVVRVARNVWEWLRDRHGEKSGATASEAIRQIVAADPATLNEQARQAVEQEAGSLPAIEREVLLDYLTQVPGRVRATFSRPEDPEGKTVPAAWTIRSSDDLLPFLPPRLPEIRPGDSPAGAPQWELVERLGSGGFGEVWKARHRQSERQLTAFKFCLDPAAQRDLLAHELRLIETVQQHLRDHPHIVRLIDFDLAADRPWLRYEFILGQELGRWLRTQPSDPNKREEIVRDILHTLAQTLAPCHAGFDAEDGRRVRIVHRDLKPENVLIDSRGQLKVADFGIGQVQSRQALAQADEWTRYSRVGTGLSILASAFTPLYASPEQRRGEPPDPTDDVYALGVLAYQMLVGNLRAEPGPDLDDELKDLGISELIRQVLRKSLAARRERRWQDAGALSSALRQGGKAAAPSHGSRREVSAKDSPPSPIPGSPPVTHRVQPTDDLAAVVARLPEGAVVELEAGTYELREPLRIDKSLTLRGPDRDHCAIVSAAPEA
ncbi:MAG: serine/threonine protein kinase, partial [Gemmataceae bacterium]|nr:serine/threonine protein kinase [Gemmataceae bacterium]